MKINASRCSALMIAAGVWLACAGPLHAQETAPAAPPAAAQQATVPNPLQQLFGLKPAPAAEPAAAEQPGRPIVLNKYRKTSSRRGHGRKTARTHRASRNAVAETRAAPEAKADVKADTKAAAEVTAKPEAVAAADNGAPVPVPLSTSVANARAEAPDDTPAADNAAPPASAPTAKAETGVVTADEVNEVDRAMAAQPAPTPMLALASVNAPEPVTTGQAASAGDDNSSWARASLIGKIFIGFGGLLTLASAIRMLIA